jgi:hypothetical protein
MTIKPRNGPRVRWTLLRVSGAYLLAALAISMGLASPRGADAARKAIPDVKVLFRPAVETVRATDFPTYAGAVMLEAQGSTSDGLPTSSAAGIDQWQFWLQNGPSNSQFLTAMIPYGPPPATFGQVTGYASAFVGDRELPKAPAMSLREAVRRLQRAGYTSAFYNVTLRNRLVQEVTHPEYIFGFSLHFHVAVDTVTRQVYPVTG